MRFLASAVLALVPLVAFGQGISDSSEISFENTKVKVTDLAHNFLLEFGQEDAPELNQSARRESADGKYVVYDLVPYRLTLPKGNGEIARLENVPMLTGGAPSPTVKPRYVDFDAAKKHVEKFVSLQRGAWLSQDPDQMNGLYVLEERTVPASEAVRNHLNGGRPYHLFRYGIRQGGYDFLIEPVYVEVLLDAAKGDLISFSRDVRAEDFGSLNGENLPEKDAKAIANGAVPGESTGKWLGWVYPNRAWNAAVPGNEARLAWIFAFGKKQVWVDARTAKIVGGVP